MHQLFRQVIVPSVRSHSKYLTKSCLHRNCYQPSAREFGQRALAGGNMWRFLSCILTLEERFDKNSLETGTEGVASHPSQKTVQQYWVNVFKEMGVPHSEIR